MTAPPTPHGPATQPDPTKDQDGKPVPEGIAAMLLLTRILAAYGRHLAALLPQRELWPGFAAVTRFLLATSLSGRLARIHRGIMRAVALERLLLRRAARGRDLRPLAPLRPQANTKRSARASCRPNRIPEHEAAYRAFPLPDAGGIRTPAASPWDNASEPSPQNPTPHQATPQPPANRRPSDRHPVWLETLPSMAELEQEVRRRAIGRTIAAICLDLGISPGLCAGWFWNDLFHAMQDYRGGMIGMLTELRRRELQFEYEGWKHPGLPPARQTPQAVRQALGFLVGEPPVDPPFLAAPLCPPVPATGPP